MQPLPAKQVIGIFGPTCSWKSDAALLLATRLNGEIISCDSMQIYRGLDIGTAKPSAEMRRKIPHHLIDILDINQRHDAEQFVKLATKSIMEIDLRGHLPIIAGGTGLYAKALIYGMNLLPSDHELSMQLRKSLNSESGIDELLRELELACADKDEIPQDIRQNPRHLMRAVEILRLTGKLSWKLKNNNQEPPPNALQFCLLPELSLLKARIKARTKKMLDDGWIEEALTANEHGLLQTPTAAQALGYRDIIALCQNNHCKRTDLEDLLASRTIAYARRQMTWFKHQHPGAILIQPTSAEHAEQLMTDYITKTTRTNH